MVDGKTASGANTSVDWPENKGSTNWPWRQRDDPWAGQGHLVQNIDLVAFFRYVRENRVDFFHVSVESVAAAVRAEKEGRP